MSAQNAGPVLRRLAEGHNKSLRSTAYYLEFETLLRVFTREPSYVYQVESSPFRFSGDIFYKGFDVSEQLSPDQIRFKLRLEKPNGQFMEIPMEGGVNDGKAENISYNDKDTIGYQFTRYRLENFVFRYGNHNNLEKKVGLINEYYQVVAEIDRGFALLQTVNPAFLENFRNNQRNLLEAEQILTRAEQRNIGNDLPLRPNDPARYQEKLNMYRNTIISRRQELNLVFSTLHLTFYDKAMYHLRRNNLARAREFLAMSLEVNPMFSPALLQWATIDLQNGDLHEARCKAEDILFNMPADPETREGTMNLLRDILDEYLERGEEAVQRSAFRKALDEFEAAAQLCRKHSKLRGDERAQEGIRKAKAGIYRDFLQKARQQAAAGNLEDAEQSARDGIRYQQANPEISDLAEAREVLRAIHQKKYERTLDLAMKLAGQKQYEPALLQLQKSDSMLIEFELTRSSDYPKLCAAIVRPHILELLYEGDIFVNNNNLPRARQRYRTASDLQRKYEYTKDADIQKHLESLRKSIFNQQCLNAQAGIDSAFNAGQIHAAQGYFLAAGKAYQFALDLAHDNADCSIPTDSVEQAAFSIRPAVTFYTFLEKSNEDMKSGRYQSSIDNFLSASRYFNEMQVSRFGIDFNPDLFTYLRDKGDNGLINYSGDYFRERGELEKSLAQYKLLLGRNYDPKLMSGALYQLGLSLGGRDRNKFPGAKWKDLSGDYTGGDKRLKRLAKGYKAGFKR